MLEHPIAAVSTEQQPPTPSDVSPAEYPRKQADVDGLHAGQMAVAI
jgi:hypothetical protein